MLGVLGYMGFLSLVAVDCLQSMEQGCNLQKLVKTDVYNFKVIQIDLVLRFLFQASSYLLLMGFSDSNGPLEIFPWLSFRLLLFGLTFERESLLELFWDMKGIKVSWFPGNFLKDDRNSDLIR